jgi:hypothetical protein
MTFTDKGVPDTAHRLFRSLGRKNAYEEGATEIRKLIFERRLQALHRLPTERELAEQFGVGRTVVRDPTNLGEVVWAMITRSRPAQSIDILRETWSTYLDPSLNPPEIRPWGSKCIINACKEFKYIKTFSPRNLLKKETYETICARWNELGFEGQPPTLTVFEPFDGAHIA